MLGILSVILYLAAQVVLILPLIKKNSGAKNTQSNTVLWLIAAGLAAHLAAAYISISGEDGYYFSFFKMPSLFFVVINSVVLLSSLRKPLRNLFLFLLPFSIIAIGIDNTLGLGHQHMVLLSPGLAAHVVLSILAYSLLTIASLQALFLAYQNRLLKRKQLRGVVGLLPPLQTMESLLFELLWAGQILLTLSILSGAIFIESLFAQHLVHKTTFSILSWVIYAVLLWGRHALGWRGNVAIRWTLCGFAALMLAYFGSKLVLEVILQRA